MNERYKIENIENILRDFEYEEGSIYLDFGCGNSYISQFIEDELKMKYVGIDKNERNVNELTAKGYEAYNIIFKNSKDDLDTIKQVVKNRKLGCISLINFLEYVVNPEQLLSTIKELVYNEPIPVIIAVSNLGHRDIALKLLVDRFEETELGLLNKNQVSLFNETKLMDICEKNGFHMIKKNDLKTTRSEQSFPNDLLPLMKESSLSKLLNEIRDGVDETGDIEQIIRLFLVGPRKKEEVIPHEDSRPFLSIITRTQGKRIETLKEVFICLAGQECTDFEVLIMGHNVEKENKKLIEAAINETPQWLKEKIKYVRVDGGNRSTPLNDGFELARGEYISILDDDDIVFGNWIDVFKKLSENNYGKILRSVTVRQEYEPVVTQYSQNTSRAVSGFLRDYPSEFDFLQMLHHNQCPGLCLAFPASVFRDFGLRFDENLNTIEDWDFIMRAVFLCGVASSPDVTSIYRWWKNGENSRALHQEEEWQKNYEYVQNKLNSKYIILPPGIMKRIVELVDAYNRGLLNLNIESEINQIHLERNQIYHERHQINYERDINYKRYIANELLTSNSWKITKPLRMVKRLLGKKTEIPNLFLANEQQLDELISNIYNSKSWKITKVFRRK
ncbi:putative Glycosyl transferase family A [Clostridium neonatale]|uniref:methyltransferase domain-containing protein n=1 Tax=Clostridium neonatale TaxID=137838 RepID=UPI001DEE2D64|nr:methyltransferase domain-containing protein [Clostridium neonatale]CAG9713313.1 putative Glycosyl transferase family A [Clostridium neonatale]